MRCPTCGRPGGLPCVSCRSGAPGAATGDDRRARFAAVRRAPGFEAAMAYAPPADLAIWLGVLAPLAMVGFAVVAVPRFVAPGPRGLPSAFSASPEVLAFLAVWGGVIVYLLARGLRVALAPVVRDVAEVLRVDVAHHHRAGEPRRHSTSTQVLLAFEDGTRVSCEASGDAARLVAVGDLGVAYRRGRLLVGYRRFPG